MRVKILNDKTYKEECYLFGYGIMGYGVSPHMKKSVDFFIDEIEEIKVFLKKKGCQYELFGNPLEREDPTKKKKPKAKGKKPTTRRKKK